MNEIPFSSMQTEFVDYSNDVIEKLRILLMSEVLNEEETYELLLNTHNLKGAASSFGFEAYSRHCHNIENLLTTDGGCSKNIISEILLRLENLPIVADQELADLLSDGKSHVPVPQEAVKSQQATLIYVSKRNEDVELSVEDLLDVARRRNKEHNITGALLFSGYYFVQVLEGERSKLNNLYRNIQADTRHYQVDVCYVADIAERFFGNWSMVYFPDNKRNKDKLRQLTDSDVFNPESYSSKMLLHLMRKFTSDND